MLRPAVRPLSAAPTNHRIVANRAPCSLYKIPINTIHNVSPFLLPRLTSRRLRVTSVQPILAAPRAGYRPHPPHLSSPFRPYLSTTSKNFPPLTRSSFPPPSPLSSPRSLSSSLNQAPPSSPTSATQMPTNAPPPSIPTSSTLSISTTPHATTTDPLDTPLQYQLPQTTAVFPVPVPPPLTSQPDPSSTTASPPSACCESARDAPQARDANGDPVLSPSSPSATALTDQTTDKAAAKAAAHAAYLASGSQLRTKRPPGMVKRSIALHLGYVGTSFNGLQVNRASSPDSTVEAVLESAVYGAGLIAESNMGDLKKIKWTRNSRTDKGVHSVASVVGLRVLLPGDDGFDSDPEGLQIASELNTRLPPQIRVFSAQRVNKKFHARRFCFDRTYEYLLPAHLLLGPTTSPTTHATTATPTSPSPPLSSSPAPLQQQQPPAQAQALPPIEKDISGSWAPGLAEQRQQLKEEKLGEASPLNAWEGGSDGGGNSDAEGMAAAMALLREALGCFVGTHPFHNYTARRKSYVDKPGDQASSKVAQEAGAAAAASSNSSTLAETTGTENATSVSPTAFIIEPEVAAGVSGNDNDDDEDDGGGDGDEASGDFDERNNARRKRGEGRGAEARSSKARAKDEDDPLEEDEEYTEEESSGVAEEGEEGLGGGGGASSDPHHRSAWIQACRWLHTKSDDPRDRITARHFRSIVSFTADDPAPLVPGGVPCVRLRVRGMSFMLHQIRHMIGGAIAVTRGLLPLPLLRASLSVHSRVTVPRAPPHALLLADCTFPPFRKAGGEEAKVARWTGERLTLRDGGQAARAAFRQECLDRALNDLLNHPDWERFEQCLPRFYWDPQAQEEVVRAHVAWGVLRAEWAEQKRKAAEAEAAAAAEEGSSNPLAVATDDQDAPAAAAHAVPAAAASASGDAGGGM